MKKKSDLPSKLCRECEKPMAWRKAWARSWDQVLYCSDRCQREASRKRRVGPAETDRTAGPSPR